MRAVSLFTGAGGMDVGFVKCGVSVIWANEIDEDAGNTYRLNNPNTVLRQGDIKTLKSELETFDANSVDLVFGGPPCQGFSIAGKMNPNDERSQLIWEFLDVVRILKPRFFVMENVKALGELERWKSIRTKIVETAEKIGYSCFYRILNAADYGVPQKRERVFFIGFLNAKKSVEILFDTTISQQKLPRIELRNCLKQLPQAGTDKNPITCTAKISLAANPVLRKSPYAGMLFNGLGRPLDLDNQANTLPASMGGNKTPILDEMVLNNPNAPNWIQDYHSQLYNKQKSNNTVVPNHIRRITTVEAAAIQTFPSDYLFAGEKSSVYRQIGNAVPCNLAAAVAKATVESLKSIS